jgi:hypothetical protein
MWFRLARIVTVDMDISHVTVILWLRRFPVALYFLRQIQQAFEFLPRVSPIFTAIEVHRLGSNIDNTVIGRIDSG